MKKRMILDLIKYHADKNENEFRRTAYEIAKEFAQSGESELGEYIMGQLAKADTLSIQTAYEPELKFFMKSSETNGVLPLPESIQQDLVGVGNAILHHAGVHKFLFEGAPGTGKTESAKQLARLLHRDLFEVDSTQIIDSHLGQTGKNIHSVFQEMNQYPYPSKAIFLLDEIDSLALDRINNHDLREMGRATTALLKGMDELHKDVAFIATTNLYKLFDKALGRRFDAIVHFDRYTQEDLKEIAVSILNEQIKMYPGVKKDIRFFRKILSQSPQLPMPGDLKNIIKMSLAFSNPKCDTDYLRRLLNNLVPGSVTMTPEQLKKNGFTVREISVLTQVPKSSVARKLEDK